MIYLFLVVSVHVRSGHQVGFVVAGTLYWILQLQNLFPTTINKNTVRFIQVFYDICYMKRQVLLTVIFILLSQLLLAQAKTDTIGTKMGWLGGTWRTYEGKKIRTTHKLSTIIRQDPDAFHFIKKSRRARAIELTLDCAALVSLTAYENYTSPYNFSHQNFNPNIFLAAGIGCLAGAYVFLFSDMRNQKKAVSKFNNDRRKTGYNEETQPQLYFSFTGTTMGIGLRF